jgi:TatD DNase family protein
LSRTDVVPPSADPHAPALIDTHCHLALLDERGLLERALDGAAAAGVDTIVSVGLDADDSERNRVIAEANDGVVFSVGWHPHQPSPPDGKQLEALDALLSHPRAVAVGEIGLDLFFRPGYHEVPESVQRRSLRIMLELAAKRDKPVLVHDRDAHDEVMAAIGEVAGVRGIMHCFSGDLAHARRCTRVGFVISFSGIVTFARTEALRDAAAHCPADSFVVETDAPFLAPVPHRGTVNLPERVADTARAIAALRGVSDKTVREQTTLNARRMLGIDGRHGQVGASP